MTEMTVLAPVSLLTSQAGSASNKKARCYAGLWTFREWLGIKLVEPRGIEPLTLALRTLRSPN